MNEYELLCHRERQLLLNASMNNNNKNNNNLSLSSVNNLSHKNDNNFSSNANNCQNLSNNLNEVLSTGHVAIKTNVCQNKCKSLDVSLEDVLNCNDIQIETFNDTNDIKLEEKLSNEAIEGKGDSQDITSTIPRTKKCESSVKSSKSLPVSQSNSFDCILDGSQVESLAKTTRSLAEDRDFVTKL